MAGFFKMWGVSGLTTDGAKISQPIHELGVCLRDPQHFASLNASYKADLIGIGEMFITMKEIFDRYLNKQSKALHDDSVKFLVMVAAILQGQEGQTWSWQAVRHYAQGLYGSMDENYFQFFLKNHKIFDNVAFEIQCMLDDAAESKSDMDDEEQA